MLMLFLSTKLACAIFWGKNIQILYINRKHEELFNKSIKKTPKTFIKISQ